MCLALLASGTCAGRNGRNGRRGRAAVAQRSLIMCRSLHAQALHKELGEEGLITCDETEESEVTAQEATDFWMATKESTQSVEVELEEEEEDEFGDFD
jgi:hypothetical protein